MRAAAAQGAGLEDTAEAAGAAAAQAVVAADLDLDIAVTAARKAIELSEGGTHFQAHSAAAAAVAHHALATGVCPEMAAASAADALRQYGAEPATLYELSGKTATWVAIALEALEVP